MANANKPIQAPRPPRQPQRSSSDAVGGRGKKREDKRKK